MNISQSLIKSMQSYLYGNACGKVIEFQYVHGHLTPTKGVMLEGQYFEYQATGALPKDGEDPKPELLKKGPRRWSSPELKDYMELGTMPGTIKTPPDGIDDRQELNTPLLNLDYIEAIHKEAVAVGSMTTNYRRAWKQAQEFKRQCEEIGIEILSTQDKGERDGLNGTRDIHFKWTKGKREGQTGTIDLKYSGLINNDYELHGWGFRDYNPDHRGHRKQMDYHKIQALQYGHIFNEPFFYWVFSSATGAEDTGENIFLEMSYDEFELDQHIKRSQHLWSEFEYNKALGFEARPGYNRCKQCPFFEICEDKQIINEPVLVKIVSE